MSGGKSNPYWQAALCARQKITSAAYVGVIERPPPQGRRDALKPSIGLTIYRRLRVWPQKICDNWDVVRGGAMVGCWARDEESPAVDTSDTDSQQKSYAGAIRVISRGALA